MRMNSEVNTYMDPLIGVQRLRIARMIPLTLEAHTGEPGAEYNKDQHTLATRFRRRVPAPQALTSRLSLL